MNAADRNADGAHQRNSAPQATPLYWAEMSMPGGALGIDAQRKHEASAASAASARSGLAVLRGATAAEAERHHRPRGRPLPRRQSRRDQRPGTHPTFLNVSTRDEKDSDIRHTIGNGAEEHQGRPADLRTAPPG